MIHLLLRNVILLLLFSTTGVISSPMIEFDTKTVDCGAVIEGKSETLSAVFTVRNSGDSTLSIQEVHPGCGCIVVNHDTLIAPGATGSIKALLTLKGYQPGLITKKITVQSNASNKETSRLTVTAHIRPIVGTSVQFISVDTGDSVAGETLYLTSVKKGLKVASVIFTPDHLADSLTMEQKTIPLRFSCTLTDSLADDGNFCYKLALFNPGTLPESTGTFTVNTNNRQYKQLTLRGTLN